VRLWAIGLSLAIGLLASGCRSATDELCPMPTNRERVYTFTGNWSAPDGSWMCLRQESPDVVGGAVSKREATGIVRQDGELSLAVGSGAPALLVMRADGDTLRLVRAVPARAGAGLATAYIRQSN